MKKFMLLIFIAGFGLYLFCQEKPKTDIDQWLNQTEEEPQNAMRDSIVTNDLIKVNYNRKSAQLAMVMSMLVPGAGQFYANKTVLTTYIFPVLEIGLIGGLVYFNNEGKDKTNKYEKYANGEKITYTTANGEKITGYRYDRAHQNIVQDILCNVNQVDIYDESYFRLDDTNTQHFYEDIGKYPQYVFGWMDWYYRFAADASGNPVSPNWQFDGPSDSPQTHWIGNYPTDGTNTGIPVSIDSPEMSSMRQTYIRMRNDAKDSYSVAHLFTLGLAFNHLAAGLDAIRVTRNFNRYYISQTVPSLNFYAAMPSGNVTPMLGLKWNF
ncbi:MAG TPA: hypothetical protein PLL35_00570 [Candidatus Cloacimonas sp.]|nr:hypothetical protein [Candidatus Cloacimonas sp.]